MIDSQLLPKASNSAVKRHLTETREHVTAHLQKAKKLQGRNAVCADIGKGLGGGQIRDEK